MRALLRVLLLMVISSAGLANSPDVQKILDCAAENGPERTFSQQAEFVTYHPDESKRAIHAKVIGARIDKSLGLNIEVESPNSMAGTVILFKETEGQDTTRIFLPSIRRAQNVSGSMAATKVLGTDFSYLDVKQLYGAFIEGEKSYLGEVKVGDRVAHRISIKPGPEEMSPYIDQETHIDKQTCVVLAVDFIAEGGDVLKRLEANPGSISEMEGRYLAHEYTMYDHLSSTRTTVVMDQIEFDPKIRKSVFHTQMFMGAKN